MDEKLVYMYGKRGSRSEISVKNDVGLWAAIKVFRAGADDGEVALWLYVIS